MRIGINAHLLSREANYRQAGVSQYILQLLRHLPADTHPHHYVAFTPPNGAPDFLVHPNLQIVPTRLPTARPAPRIAWEQVVAPLAARRHRLQLLHSPVNVAPLLLPCRSVVTIHDLAFLVYQGRLSARRRHYLRIMTRLSARQADRVIAVSHQTARDVVDRLNVDPALVSVVPEAAADMFVPSMDARSIAAFRHQHGMSEQSVLFVGTLEPRKNLPMLLQAVARLRQEFPALCLYIVGGRGWMYDSIDTMVGQLGLRESVRFVGYVQAEDLPLWYQAATVLAYPSVYEGFGLPPLEAMACGTPVVTSNVSSIPEVVGDAAITVDPNDDDALAAALRAVLSDPARRAAMAAAGLRRAALFSWSRVADETRAIYDEVLATDRPRRW